MRFVSVAETEYPLFHRLMNDYYREGEDAQTPQDELDGFIRMLYDFCAQGKIMGAVAYDSVPVGFVLWNIDSSDGVFCQKPGFGTILEIGICPEFRRKNLGTQLVKHAIDQMPVTDHYVCAYGPAETFWRHCGFWDSNEIGSNGLKIYVRQSDGFEG